MIPFFSTSAPHYHTDICPNDCYNACTHTHACLLQHTHSMPVTLPLSNVHLGHLPSPNHLAQQMDLLSLLAPFCLLRACYFSPQFGVVWWMQMATYLIGSVPKMEINGYCLFSFLPSRLFWAVLSSAVCGENINEEGQGGDTGSPGPQNCVLQKLPSSNTAREVGCLSRMCDTTSVTV